MTDKVFWGTLGGILVSCLAVFIFAVIPKINEYSTLAEDLESTTRKMRKYANLPASQLPTEKLAIATQKYYELWNDNYEDAVKIYQKRDKQFEEGSENVSLADWVGRYRDEFKELRDRYIKHVNLPEDTDDKAIPFRKIPDLNDAAKIPEYQKAWRIQRTIVEAILSYDRSKLREYRTKRGRELDRMGELEHFDRMRIEVEAELPAEKPLDLLSKLLGDPSINFEVYDALVIKSKEGMQFKIVEQLADGENPPPQPVVFVRLVLDVLDWKAEG